jgi:hypothetical protein
VVDQQNSRGSHREGSKSGEEETKGHTARQQVSKTKA